MGWVGSGGDFCGLGWVGLGPEILGWVGLGFEKVGFEKVTHDQLCVEGDMKNCDFRPMSRFVSETIQDSASYNGRRIGSRTRSIELCHFQ